MGKKDNYVLRRRKNEKVVMAYFNALSHYSFGQSGDNHKNPVTRGLVSQLGFKSGTSWTQVR
jgi:hypothetical protein